MNETQLKETSNSEVSDTQARWVAGVLGGVQIAAGTYLSVCSAGILSPLGSVLISSGANGVKYAYKEEKITAGGFAETSAWGALSGGISCGVLKGFDLVGGWCWGTAEAVGEEIVKQAVQKTGEEVIKKGAEITTKEMIKAGVKEFGKDAAISMTSTAVNGAVESVIKQDGKFSERVSPSTLFVSGVTAGIGGQVNKGLTNATQITDESRKAVKETVKGYVGKSAGKVAMRAGAGVVGAGKGIVTSVATQTASNAMQRKSLTEDLSATCLVGGVTGAAQGVAAEHKGRLVRRENRRKKREAAAQEKQNEALQKSIEKNRREAEAAEKLVQNMDNWEKLSNRTPDALSLDDLHQAVTQQERALEDLSLFQKTKLAEIEQLRADLAIPAATPDIELSRSQQLSLEIEKLTAAQKNYKDLIVLNKNTRALVERQRQYIEAKQHLSEKEDALKKANAEQDKLAKTERDMRQQKAKLEAKVQGLGEAEKIESRYHSEEQQLQEAREHLSRLEAAQQKLDAENEGLRLEISANEQKHAACSGRISDLEDGIKRLGRSARRFVKNPLGSIRGMQDEIGRMQRDADQALVKLDKARLKLTQNSKQSLHGAIAEARNAVGTCENILAKSERALIGMKNQLDVHISDMSKPVRELVERAGKELQNTSDSLADFERQTRKHAQDVVGNAQALVNQASGGLEHVGNVLDGVRKQTGQVAKNAVSSVKNGLGTVQSVGAQLNTQLNKGVAAAAKQTANIKAAALKEAANFDKARQEAGRQLSRAAKDAGCDISKGAKHVAKEANQGMAQVGNTLGHISVAELGKNLDVIRNTVVQEFNSAVSEVRQAGAELKRAIPMNDVAKVILGGQAALIHKVIQNPNATFKSIQRDLNTLGGDASRAWKSLPPEVQTAIIVAAVAVTAYAAVTILVSQGVVVTVGVQYGSVFIPVAKLGASGLVGVGAGILHHNETNQQGGRGANHHGHGPGTNLNMNNRVPNPNPSPPSGNKDGNNTSPPSGKPSAKPPTNKSPAPQKPDAPQNEPTKEPQKPAEGAQKQPDNTTPTTAANPADPNAKKTVVGQEACQGERCTDNIKNPKEKRLGEFKYEGPAHQSKHPNNQQTQKKQREAEQRRQEQQNRKDEQKRASDFASANNFFRAPASNNSGQRPWRSALQKNPALPGDIIGLINDTADLAQGTTLNNGLRQMEDQLYMKKYGGCDEPRMGNVGQDLHGECAREKAKADQESRKREAAQRHEEVMESIKKPYRGKDFDRAKKSQKMNRDKQRNLKHSEKWNDQESSRSRYRNRK